MEKLPRYVPIDYAKYAPDLPEEAQEFTADIAVTVGDIMQSIENAFVSSPISKVLYTNNFIGLLIG